MNKDILLIQFSSRNSGNCAGVTAEIKDYYAGNIIREYRVDSENMYPCGNCDYECLRDGKRCPNRTAFLIELMDGICNCDVVYFIVPNYCGFPCASYFALNERSVGYFDGDRDLLNKYLSVKKRFVVISNSESEVFKEAMQQQTAAEPDILYLKTREYQKMGIAGDLMQSEAAKEQLRGWLANATP